ncbi:hypothetical protein EZS27_020016 [termite gut metagenome]|uniref:Uncharacterized protein n=1 Tax=termite gut metagenome TaxID=433724 RepID=A0A5J4RBC7_9ZZZZ
MFGIIKKNDKNLIKKIQKVNIDEVKLWEVPNIFIPLLIIVFTILIYSLFRPFDNITIGGCLNFLVNGSIPLIAVNQIAGVGIYIFKFNKSKEDELGIETTRHIRTALFYQVFCLLFLCMLLYSYQTINHPFENVCIIIFSTLASIVLLYFSSHVSRKIFILQDEFINLAYDTTIRETVIKTTTTQKWDDYESNE